jgi:hypothetical protein
MGEEEEAMKKVTCLLAMVAAAAIALPAMGQSPDNVVGGSPPNQAQIPQPADGNVNWKGVGIGAGTVAGNIFYVPAKMVYGVLGGITGGASYLLTGGNTQTANTIWRSSLGGDYVLTPDMVAGQKPVHFSGPTTTALPAPSTSLAAPSAMNSTRTQPASSTRTASADLGGSVNSAPIMGSAATGTTLAQPADRGTGPISSGSSISSGSAAPNRNSGVAVPPLPNTSIE